MAAAAAAAIRDRQLQYEREQEDLGGGGGFLPSMGSVEGGPVYGREREWGSPEREGLRATPRRGHPRYELAGLEPGSLRRSLPTVSRSFADESGAEAEDTAKASALEGGVDFPPKEEPARRAEGCLIDIFPCESREAPGMPPLLRQDRGCDMLGLGAEADHDIDHRAGSGCHVDNTGPGMCSVQ